MQRQLLFSSKLNLVPFILSALLLAVLVIPLHTAYGDSDDDTEANIAELRNSSASTLQSKLQAALKKIAELQERIANGGSNYGGSKSQGSTLSCLILTNSLQFGARDANTSGEVSKLQKFLAKDSSLYPEGEITGYYGTSTEKAVQRFQTKHNIVSSGTPYSTGFGAAGARTRALLAKQCEVSSDASASLFDFKVKTVAPKKVEATFSRSTPCTAYTINWGDGKKDEVKKPTGDTTCASVITNTTVSHTYATDGTYNVKLTMGGKSVTKKISTSSTTNSHSYGLTDVKTITYKENRVGNDDDGHRRILSTRYIITLTNGKVHKVTKYNWGRSSTRTARLVKDIQKTGYTGDVTALLAKATQDLGKKAYTLTDVKSVTSKYIDPRTGVADDEYTRYTIVLNNGKKHEVKVYGRTVAGTTEKVFRDTGYTGDVAALIAKAVENVADAFEFNVEALDDGKVEASFERSTPCTAYTIAWGDGKKTEVAPTASGTVCAQVIDEETVVHAYDANGHFRSTYTVTLTMNGKMVKESVRVSH